LLEIFRAQKIGVNVLAVIAQKEFNTVVLVTERNSFSLLNYAK